MPVAVTSASAVPAVTKVPAKTRSAGSTAYDSPVSADSSTRRSVARDQVGVGGDAVARGEQQDVAGDDLLARDVDRRAVAPHAYAQRQHPAQRRDRPLGPVLLDEGEDRVDDDDDHDRRGERRHPGRSARAPRRPRAAARRAARSSRGTRGPGTAPAASAIAFGPDSASRRRASSLERPDVRGSERVRMAAIEGTPGDPARASVAARRRHPWSDALHPGLSGLYHPR